MAFQELVQLIGIATVFPVLVIVGYILFSPVKVFDEGELPAKLLALLGQEIARRGEDQLEELDPKTLERLERIVRTYERLMAESEEQAMRAADETVAAFTDNAVDSAFIAQRRDELQRLLLDSLEERCRGTALAADLIKRWRYWVMLEKALLYRLAFQDVGVKAFRHFMKTVGQCMTEAAALGLIVGLFLWGAFLFNPEDKPDLLTYLGNTGALGAFVGLAYAVIILIKKAWMQHMASYPADERDRQRRAGIMVLVLLFAIGPVMYYELPQRTAISAKRLLQPLLNGDSASTLLFAVYLGGVGVFFLYRGRNAWRNWRTPGMLSRPQRFEQLSFVILDVVLGTFFIGLLWFWLAGGSPGQSKYAIWWAYLAFAGLFLILGVEAVAGLIRYSERRSQMRAFRELGLRPKRFLPMWFIVVLWAVGAVLAVPVTALVILLVDPTVAEQGEMPPWVTLTVACVLALVVVGGALHYFVGRRRRKLEQRRLISEYRKLVWTNESRHPGDLDA